MTEEQKHMSHEDIFFAQLIREGKEQSRALEQKYYGDPSRIAKMGGKKGGEVDRLSDREIADSLLMEWYRWTKQYRPNLGAPRASPYCRDYRQDEKHNEESEEAKYLELHRIEMKAVDYCISTLAVDMQQSIGCEMKNREVNRKVWRSPSNVSYTVALDAVMPVMRKRGLFE